MCISRLPIVYTKPPNITICLYSVIVCQQHNGPKLYYLAYKLSSN